MSLCLVAMFKNESHILREWLDHYRRQGVDQFLMIDNGSTDSYQDLLASYPVRVIVDGARHQQSNLYNRYFLREVKNYEWVLVCDLDEFVHARKGYATIKEYLATLDPSVSQVFIPWKIFGSNGWQTQPDLVIPSFTRRIDYDKDDGFQGVIREGGAKYSFTKCIVRSRFLQHLNIHSHETRQSTLSITTDNNQSRIHPNRAFAEISEAILADSCLHLNHYAIQSYEWFMRVKATRGAADFANNEYVRTTQYFREFDVCSNDVEDPELARQYLIGSDHVGA